MALHSKRLFTLITLLIAITLVLFHLDEHLDRGSFDDVAVYRCVAYTCHAQSTPFFKQIIQDIKHANLPQPLYETYRGRLLEFPNNYILQNITVPLFDRLPMISAYQAEFLANLAIHIASLILFMVVAWFLPGTAGVIAILFLLLSITPRLLVFISAVRLTPFFDMCSVWTNCVPRGAAALFFYTGLMALFYGKSYGWLLTSLLFFMLSFAAHFSTGLMFSVLLVLFYFIAKSFFFLRSKFTIYLLTNGMVLIIAIATLLIRYGSSTGHYLLTIDPYSTIWLIILNFMLWTWTNNRKLINQSPRTNFNLLLIQMYILSAILGCGLNLFNSDYMQLQRHDLYYLFQASVRELALPFFFFYLLLASATFKKISYFSIRIIIILIISVFLFLDISLIIKIKLKYPHVSNTLMDNKSKTYTIADMYKINEKDRYNDIPLFFHALANSYRLHQYNFH